MSIDVSKVIARELTKKIEGFEPSTQARRVGHILSVADGVAQVSGLAHAAYLELLEFPQHLTGVAVNLEEDFIGAIILGDYLKLHEGDEVEAKNTLLSIPVGEDFLGRVVSPLGEPLDGKGPITAKIRYPLEKIAPGVVARQPVSSPLQTGIKAIDALIPIGRGQRELIIGDRNTGKTAIGIDTIIHQKKENVTCIYVAIGQKASRVAQVIAELENRGALSHTIIVSATAGDSVALQYLAPYAGCALGEYFMGKGKDALVIYDDLSKHAWAYRQISLTLRRPSGREAYPGDVFYLHSRLLERACRLSDANGGGSLTALPVIETLDNDVSSYIPTNVISITDGQIYLESDLFFAGQRPAVNIGLSVSRVGGAAQIKAMKSVAGNLRLDLAQYRELAAFAQFSTDVDETTKKQIDRGSRMVELLKQRQYVPMAVEKQVAVLWAGVNGYLDDVPVDQIQEFEKTLLTYLETREHKLLTLVAKEKKITKDIEELLRKAVEDFKKRFVKKEEKEG
ncbi:F0F1 ATP synthase subunit alpha [Patescibacteria group bacterium]|nr:F0F1 ATP synthase subunit alpha [Patescibacteria group bacterium]MBU1473012.1 F0F1 ATP synthase subunit alpha [Patescibacteria group bacterium]MBU2460347.1 F0F1 ATP synthase subunit alpha [Patescibacteria group bacterium]MBU2544632.1 F0F1 ATP synthase subunit alpha [Patescibacteria group bacterium]